MITTLIKFVGGGLRMSSSVIFLAFVVWWTCCCIAVSFEFLSALKNFSSLSERVLKKRTFDCFNLQTSLRWNIGRPATKLSARPQPSTDMFKCVDFSACTWLFVLWIYESTISKCTFCSMLLWIYTTWILQEI